MWALQVLGLLADKKRARDVRLARVEYMSRRRGTSTSLVLEPPSSVHSVKSFAANFSFYHRSRSAQAYLIGYRADHRRRVIQRFIGNGGSAAARLDRISAGKLDGSLQSASLTRRRRNRFKNRISKRMAPSDNSKINYR